MTTEDLIELLQQHPGEEVAVLLVLGDKEALLPVERAFYFAANRPRVRLQVHAKLSLDSSFEDVFSECCSVQAVAPKPPPF